MQQGYELQDQVIDSGHYSLKSHSELLQMQLFLICTEHFWNLKMEKALTTIIKDSLIIDSDDNASPKSTYILLSVSLLLKSSHANEKNALLTTILNAKKKPPELTLLFGAVYFLICSWYVVISLNLTYPFLKKSTLCSMGLPSVILLYAFLSYYYYIYIFFLVGIWKWKVILKDRRAETWSGTVTGYLGKWSWYPTCQS